jgi:hypothetical protein
MPEVSTSRPVNRIPAQRPKNRLGNALFSGTKTVVFSFARILYVLWLQVTGVVFAAFTLMGASALVGLYRKHAWIGDPRRFWVTAGFTIGCGLLTIWSFLRASRTEKKSKAKP